MLVDAHSTGTWQSSEPWYIGLPAWVLLDGNYGEIVVSDRLEFALECRVVRDKLLSLDGPSRRRNSRHTGRGSSYEICGQILHADPDPLGGATIVDFGLLAFTQGRLTADTAAPSVGDWITGIVGLSVDPFTYRDQLAGQAGMPALSYSWVIEQIDLDDTPRVEVRFGNPLYVGPDEGPYLVADPARERWRPVERTLRRHDGGRNYRLRCSLASSSPVNPSRSPRRA